MFTFYWYNKRRGDVMSLFRKNKESDAMDDRTNIERKFEEKGQVIGAKAGKFAQKSVDKFHQVKEKIEPNTFDKVTAFADKAEKKIDKITKEVTQKTKDLLKKSVDKDE